MCRMLALRTMNAIDPNPWIEPFAQRCRESKEFQGDGWGVAWRTTTGWERYRSLRPIWEDDPVDLPPTDRLVVHARSAFRNEGLVVENNMPFLLDPLAFAFNGELHGVRLRVPGETGATRLLHLLERFRASEDGDLGRALKRLDRVIVDRSDYVRALNLVVSDGVDIWLHSHYSEDPDYFTLHTTSMTDVGGGLVAASSERFDLPDTALTWAPVSNRTTIKLESASPCS